MVCLHFLFFMDGLLSGSIPNPPLLDSEVGANLKQEASWMGRSSRMEMGNTYFGDLLL